MGPQSSPGQKTLFKVFSRLEERSACLSVQHDSSGGAMFQALANHTLHCPRISDWQRSPVTPKFPLPNSKPTIITLLGHCDCPFAERTLSSLPLRCLRTPNHENPAVSHSDRPPTDEALDAVGGSGSTKVTVDSTRELYFRLSQGLATAWHVESPQRLRSAYELGGKDYIWNHTESTYRERST